MRRIVEFELEDGSKAFMEVDEVSGDGLRQAGGTGEEDTAEKAGRLERALLQVRPAAESVVGTLRDINAPAEITLEFSLKFSSKVNAFLFASADSESSFRVELKWKNE